MFVFGLYFASVPIIAVVAAIVDPWVRMRFVIMAVLAINTMVYGSTIILLNPNLTSEVFKINQRTKFLDDFDGHTGNYQNL